MKMSKLVSLFSVFFFATCFSSPVFAESGAVNSVGFRVGQVALFGSLGRSFKDNIGFGVDYRKILSEQFDLGAAVIYSSHSKSRYRLTQIPVTALYKFMSDEVMKLYAGGGVGFAYHSLKTGSGQNGGLGFLLATQGGASFKLSPEFEVGADLTFCPLFNTNIDVDGRGVEVSGSSATLLIRMGYMF